MRSQCRTVNLPIACLHASSQRLGENPLVFEAVAVAVQAVRS